MKFIIILLIQMISTIAFTQILFPSNFKINPVSNELTQMNIEKIVQYRIIKKPNSTKNDTIIDYLFSHHKKYFSLKQDFQKEWRREFITIESNKEVINDSLNSIWLYANTFVLFNEKKYYHNEKTKIYRDDVGEYTGNWNFDINSIIYYKKPSSNFNILDGVYIKVNKDTVSQTVKDIYFENRIIKKEFYYNNTLSSTLDYYYKDFYKNGEKYKLLTTIRGSEYRFANKDLIETKFEYQFSTPKKN